MERESGPNATELLLFSMAVLIICNVKGLASVASGCLLRICLWIRRDSGSITGVTTLANCLEKAVAMDLFDWSCGY